MNLLAHVIENIFKVNMAVKRKEKVLILIDKNKRRVRALLFCKEREYCSRSIS